MTVSKLSHHVPNYRRPVSAPTRGQDRSTIDQEYMRDVMHRLLAMQAQEKIDRLFRRAPNFKRAAMSSTSHIALRGRDLAKMAGFA